jgi:hypothetical protein
MGKILVINGHGAKTDQKIQIQKKHSVITPGSAETSYALMFHNEARHLEEMTSQNKIWPIINNATGKPIQWHRYRNTTVNDVSISPWQSTAFKFNIFAQELLNNKKNWGTLTNPPHSVLGRGALAVKMPDHQIKIFEGNELHAYLQKAAQSTSFGEPLFFCDKELGKIKPMKKTSLSEIYAAVDLISEFKAEGTDIILGACSGNTLENTDIMVKTNLAAKQIDDTTFVNIGLTPEQITMSQKKTQLEYAELMVRQLEGTETKERVQNYIEGNANHNEKQPLELVQFQFISTKDRDQFLQVIDNLKIKRTKWVADTYGNPIIQIVPTELTQYNARRVHNEIRKLNDVQKEPVSNKPQSGPEIPLKLNIAWITEVTRDEKNKCWVISGTSGVNRFRALSLYDDGTVWHEGAEKKYNPKFLPPDTFVSEVYTNRESIGKYFHGKEFTFPAPTPPAKSAATSSAKSAVNEGPKIDYSINWTTGENLPSNVTENPMWKLYQEIEKRTDLEPAHKAMTLGVLKTQLFVNLNKEWIAEMGVLFRTGQKEAFTLRKKEHLESLKNSAGAHLGTINFNDEATRLDDVLRGPAAPPYPLAIHPSMSYIAIKDSQPQKEKVIEAIKAEITGFEMLADRILNLKEADKNIAVKALVNAVKCQESGCAAKRFSDAIAAAVVECVTAEAKYANIMNKKTVNEIASYSGLTENMQEKLQFLKDEDEATDFNNYQTLFDSLKENKIQLVDEHDEPYNLELPEDRARAAEAFFFEGLKINLGDKENLSKLKQSIASVYPTVELNKKQPSEPEKANPVSTNKKPEPPVMPPSDPKVEVNSVPTQEPKNMPADPTVALNTIIETLNQTFSTISALTPLKSKLSDFESNIRYISRKYPQNTDLMVELVGYINKDLKTMAQDHNPLKKGDLETEQFLSKNKDRILNKFSVACKRFIGHVALLVDKDKGEKLIHQANLSEALSTAKEKMSYFKKAIEKMNGELKTPEPPDITKLKL